MALCIEVVHNGRIALKSGDVGAETQTHDAGWANRLECESELLILNDCIADGYRLLEIKALDSPAIQVADVKIKLVGISKGRAILWVNCTGWASQQTKPQEPLPCGGNDSQVAMQ